MRAKNALLCAVVIVGLSIVTDGQSSTGKTVVKNAAARAMLIGQHRLSLQWISWDYFGKAIVKDDKGVLRISGEQKGRGSDDYLKINGIITLVDAKEIRFNGTIVTKVSHINGGNACTREGEMTFRVTGNRRYWRLKEMENPCEQVVDYVDIYFR